MIISGLLAFAPTPLVAAGSPGPSITALVARVLAHGLRDVLPFLVAMCLTVAVTGLAVVAQTCHGLFLAPRIVGILAGWRVDRIGPWLKSNA